MKSTEKLIKERIKALEEENKKYEEIILKQETEIRRLSEENLMLQELNVCIGCTNGLQQRIDKAIEYLKLYRNSEANWIEFTIEDKLYMIEILKGE